MVIRSKRKNKKNENVEGQRSPILNKFYYEESGSIASNIKYGPVVLNEEFSLLVGKAGAGKTRFFQFIMEFKRKFFIEQIFTV